MNGSDFEVGDIIVFNDSKKKAWVIETRATARLVQDETGERQWHQNRWLASLVTFQEHVELSPKELIGFEIASQQHIIDKRKDKIEQYKALNAQTRENIRQLKQKQKEAK